MAPKPISVAHCCPREHSWRAIARRPGCVKAAQRRSRVHDPAHFHPPDRRGPRHMTDASRTPDSELTAEERDLGMDRDITRRDFLNTVALGTGAALLGAPAPAFHARPGGPLLRPPATPGDPWDSWTGYPGVGDYARSNGNTWDVVTAAHGLRDGTY